MYDYSYPDGGGQAYPPAAAAAAQFSQYPYQQAYGAPVQV